MKFTLIIPTKNRRETAIKAVKSGTMSRYDDIEIIVTDGSDDDSLGKEIKKLKDPRIKYFHHAKSLSMKNNWEFGVSKATGDYVSIIGDDDALMPDGLLFAERIIKKSGTPVLYTAAPTYKWPDYSFLNRRNLITLNLPTTVIKVSDPKEELRRNYEFKGRCGTGPGIYQGLVQREFLNELKSKRGFYFKDENPDFDSGFCTLLYAKVISKQPTQYSYQAIARQVIQGLSVIERYVSEGFSEFLTESTSSREDILWSELDKLICVEVSLISALRRFLPEVNKVLPGKKIKLNKQNIFDLLAKGISQGYESSTFKYEVKTLKSLAEKWGVSPAAIPTKKHLNMGIITDKHKSLNHKKNERINKIFITVMSWCKDIFDAMKIVNSFTVDWSVFLFHLGHTKNISSFEKPTYKFARSNCRRTSKRKLP